MNRTTVFLALAGALLLIAVVIGVPKGQSPQPAPVAPPTPTPIPVAVPKPPTTPDVAGALTLTGQLSHPLIPTGTSDLYASLEVTARTVDGAKRLPVNLALVIDRSGSMAGDKIENARLAAHRLVDLLGPDDRLSLIHYGSDVEITAGRFMTPENKAFLHRVVSGIHDEGGTNIGEGLNAGAAQIAAMKSDFRVNRLLLISDGQPTVGVTSVQALAQLVARHRQAGISVTSLGVGSDFNEDLMQRLADVGGGSYGFIANASEMTALFERDLQQAGTMVARGVSVSFTVPQGVQVVEVFGRPFSRQGAEITVSLPDFSARQVERLVVQLQANPTQQSGAFDVASAQLRYVDVLAEHDAHQSLSLSSMVTNDLAQVRQRRDSNAVLAATKARAAVNYQAAAEAMDKGDFDGARATIEKNKGLFDDAKDVVPQAAMDEEVQNTRSFFGLSESAAAAPEPERKAAVKQMKLQSSKSSGFGASRY